MNVEFWPFLPMRLEELYIFIQELLNSFLNIDALFLTNLSMKRLIGSEQSSRLSTIKPSVAAEYFLCPFKQPLFAPLHLPERCDSSNIRHVSTSAGMLTLQLNKFLWNSIVQLHLQRRIHNET
jgi:hypothetical protein